MIEDISKEIEIIVNYCRQQECSDCKYHSKEDDGMCDLHNPTAWNV